VLEIADDKFALTERARGRVVGGVVGKVRPIVGRTKDPQPAATYL
jgi:hypothetical protein